MIKAINIDKYYNRFRRNKIHVINNTTLNFPDKGLIALLGPSGCGKTTLLNVLGGLDKVRKGKIYINGKKITHRSQNYVDKIRNLNIGYIFQDYKLVETASVYDNVALSLRLVGIKNKKEIEKRVLYVLDKVGLLRYKNRPCNMLSGGERQRVGIARAIVKNPNIIIADEPTGNLDSKNSIEIMNIIRAISKNRLVILVTHEKDLAKFYATHIVELEDGTIVKGYVNEQQEELDYNIINNIYLKDYKVKKEFDNINVYSNDDENIKLDIVIQNNNIYIKTTCDKKIEVVDEDSSIKMIDDYYKNISKKDVDKYDFNFDQFDNSKKLRYSSIFNPITFITNGFKKVLNYSPIKKILLVGFFLSGTLIMYATSSITASLTLKDENFVKLNKNYLIIETKKNSVEEYLKLENELDKYYMLPSDSEVTIKLKVDDYYQTSLLNLSLTGSLSSLNMLKEKDIIKGRMPENDNEVVVDKMVIKKALGIETTKMSGLINQDEFLNRDLLIDNLPNMKIVGIVDLKSPSIYVNENDMFNIIYHTKDNQNNEYDNTYVSTDYYSPDENNKVDNYQLYQDKLTLKEGRWPENDYETIVEYSNKDIYKLNTEIKEKVNGHKLKVVGYYETKYRLYTTFVNYNTMKYNYIATSSNISIYPKDKEEVLSKVKNEYKMNIKDSYSSSRDEYIKIKKVMISSSLISSGIILAISLIEILLMIRASFLSRIKEVGIYRAIGLKKKDIYVMFSGEIISITTLASVPGIVLTAYILRILSSIEELQEYLIVRFDIVLLSIIIIYLFNLVVGLIPVFKTIRKRPAEILSRNDI